MPGQDGTGPAGQGAMTGRGFGPCGTGKRFRRGLNRCFGMGWRMAQTSETVELSKEQKTKILEAEKAETQAELKEIEKKLKDLKG